MLYFTYLINLYMDILVFCLKTVLVIFLMGFIAFISKYLGAAGVGLWLLSLLSVHIIVSPKHS